MSDTHAGVLLILSGMVKCGHIPAHRNGAKRVQCGCMSPHSDVCHIVLVLPAVSVCVWSTRHYLETMLIEEKSKRIWRRSGSTHRQQ